MSYDPTPAAGAGSEIFDAPTRFYLTNQAQIDEWYALRSNVSEALGTWFRSTVLDTLADAGAERELSVSEAKGPGSYHSLVLHPSATPVLGTKPVIGIGLTWSAKAVNPISNQPFAAVRCSRNQTGRLAAQTFLDAGGRDYRTSTKGVSGGDTDAWPAYSWIKANENWWTDLDSYRDAIVSGVLRLVDDLREPLELAATVVPVGGAEESE